MTTHPLLETYLRQLRLPMFLSNYRKFAEDSAQANLSYDRFLLALAELEVAQREKNHDPAAHQGGSLSGDQGTGRLRLLGHSRLE